MHTAKCVLDLNRNDLADSLEFDMNLEPKILRTKMS